MSELVTALLEQLILESELAQHPAGEREFR
jgi:hypothetical protein